MGFKIDEYAELIGKGMSAEEIRMATQGKMAKNKPPFEPFRLQWVISGLRRDKREGAISPIKRSEYARELFKIGAGWKYDIERMKKEMKNLKSIEENGLFTENKNKTSMKEFLDRHEYDSVKILQDLEREEEYGE